MILILLTAVCTALLLFGVVWIVSDGRLMHIFTPDSYRCGMAKLLLSEGNLEMACLYPKGGFSAAAHLHNCSNPPKFLYNGVEYKQGEDGHYI
jgi:hypothetical protein